MPRLASGSKPIEKFMEAFNLHCFTCLHIFHCFPTANTSKSWFKFHWCPKEKACISWPNHNLEKPVFSIWWFNFSMKRHSSPFKWAETRAHHWIHYLPDKFSTCGRHAFQGALWTMLGKNGMCDILVEDFQAIFPSTTCTKEWSMAKPSDFSCSLIGFSLPSCQSHLRWTSLVVIWIVVLFFNESLPKQQLATQFPTLKFQALLKKWRNHRMSHLDTETWQGLWIKGNVNNERKHLGRVRFEPTPVNNMHTKYSQMNVCHMNFQPCGARWFLTQFSINTKQISQHSGFHLTISKPSQGWKVLIS